MLSRRQFFGDAVSGLLSLGWAASGGWAASNPCGPLCWPHPIGLQLYTVRDVLKADPLKTLKDVAVIGYKEVELGGSATDIPASTLTQYLRESRLPAVSGHFPLESAGSKWQKSIAYSRAVGLRYMVCPFANASTVDGWKRVADLFNRAGKECKEAGIQFAYHNHLQEFRPVGNTTGYEIMATHTDPALVEFEMDVFWMVYGGQNPLEYFRRFQGRYTLLHIKDMKKKVGYAWNPRQFPPHGTIPFTEVGRGRINWRDIFAQVKEAGTRHIFVEQDVCEVPTLEAACISYDYLKHLRRI